MPWLEYLSYFVGGGLLANMVPHYVSGISGREFQSPFARPPGRGLSSSTTNVLWGLVNLVAAYFLVLKVGEFDIRATDDAFALGLGMVFSSIVLARYLGKFHGGNRPRNSE